MSWRGGIKRSKEDIKFSEIIRLRANGRCEYCLKPKEMKQLQCSHYHGRRKKSVRWYPPNCSALCSSCHDHLGANPYLHTEWFKKRLGEAQFNMLTIKANISGKPDMELLNIWLNEELKVLRKTGGA